MSFWTQDTSAARARKLEIARIVTFIMFGVFAREMAMAFHHDWSIIRGRKCCGFAGALVYFLCRHITTGALCAGVVSITRTVTGLSTDAILTIVHVRQGLILMANVLAYQIFTIRVTAIWRHHIVGWSLYGGMLVLWVLNLYASTQVDGAFDVSAVTHVISFAMTVCCTALTGLCIVGLLRANKRDDFPTSHPTAGYKDRSTLYMLHNEGATYFVISWVCQICILVVDIIDFDPQRTILAVMGITVLVITVICACRVHQDMVNRSEVSALTHTPSLTLAVYAIIPSRVRQTAHLIRRAALVRNNSGTQRQNPVPSVATAHLQLHRAPSILSRLTTNSWRSETNPTTESVEMSILTK